LCLRKLSCFAISGFLFSLLFYILFFLLINWSEPLCLCVCVCVCERVRETEKSWQGFAACCCAKHNTTFMLNLLTHDDEIHSYIWCVCVCLFVYICMNINNNCHTLSFQFCNDCHHFSLNFLLFFILLQEFLSALKL